MEGSDGGQKRTVVVGGHHAVFAGPGEYAAISY